MDISRKELRLLLLHEFRLGHKATEATRNICITMGEGALSYDTAKRWFARFKKGNFKLNDVPHPRRPPKINLEVLKILIEEEPRSTVRYLTEQLGCSHTAVEKHLHDLGKAWKYGAWVPHELTPYQLQRRVHTCMELLTSHRNYEWLGNLITGDEKWVMYVNHTRKRQWLGVGERGIATPRNGPHQKMVMLSIWWSVRGVIHWELLPAGSTITADVYCEQLDRVAEKLQEKQDKVYFLHDNARPHIAKSTHQKLLELGWSVLPHPPYSPDLAPTDYHLFRSLADHLREKKFNDEDDLKMGLNNFFDQKSKQFYEHGILSLPERWRQIIDNNGAYFVEV